MQAERLFLIKKAQQIPTRLFALLNTGYTIQAIMVDTKDAGNGSVL